MLFACYMGTGQGKIVDSKKETAKCLIGKWIPENPNQLPYTTFEFNADRSFKVVGVKNGETRRESGEWVVKDIGKVRAYTGVFNTSGFSFKMTYCGRLAGRENMYIKK